MGVCGQPDFDLKVPAEAGLFRGSDAHFEVSIGWERRFLSSPNSSVAKNLDPITGRRAVAGVSTFWPQCTALRVLTAGGAVAAPNAGVRWSANGDHRNSSHNDSSAIVAKALLLGGIHKEHSIGPPTWERRITHSETCPILIRTCGIRLIASCSLARGCSAKSRRAAGRMAPRFRGATARHLRSVTETGFASPRI